LKIVAACFSDDDLTKNRNVKNGNKEFFYLNVLWKV